MSKQLHRVKRSQRRDEGALENQATRVAERVSQALTPGPVKTVVRAVIILQETERY